MKKLLIFDLDGTLIDTLEDLKNAVNYGLKIRNYPKKSKEDVRKAIGNGVAVLVARCIPNGMDNPDYPLVLSEFRKYYSIHHSDCTIPYPGVLNVLINLKSQGYKLAVATNKLIDISRILIENMYPNIFDYVQGDEPGMQRKPAPMMIESLCRRFKVDKNETFYIGDTNVDMETAINSKIDYVLVTYGYRTKDELKVQCPNSPTIDSINELDGYLKSRFM